MAISKTANNKLKLLIVGLDGATPQYFFNLAHQGQLPFIQKLLKKSLFGVLHSTIPPLTPTAWSTFMTGVNPGQHGLFDFIEVIPKSYKIRFTNAKSRKVPTFWQVLSNYGKEVGVYNIPMTYPPEEVKGFFISGLDTPEEKSPFVYPPELKKLLIELFGDIPLDPRHLGFMRTDKVRRKVLKELQEIEKKRLKIFLWMLEKFQPEIAMIVFTITDTVQHFFWHYADKTHHLFPGKYNEFFTAIKDSYSFIDTLVAQLFQKIKQFSHSFHFLIMSDHGFGPTSSRIFYPNRLLKKLNYFSLKSERRPYVFIDKFLKAALPPKVKIWLSAKLPALRIWWEKKSNFLDMVNWQKTKAFALEILALPLGYYIHTKDRFPNGIVRDPLEYEKIVKTIIAELKKLNIKAYHKKEIYKGRFLELIPDIIINWWEEGLVFGKSFPAPPDAQVIEERKISLKDPAQWTGTHRKEGIFLLHGPSITFSKQIEAHIEDLPPTIFYLLNLPLPTYFEGKILLEYQEKDIKREEIFSDTYTQEENVFSSSEEKAIKDKLKNLGYL